MTNPDPELLLWLRERRDDCRSMAQEYHDQGDYDDEALWAGRAEAFQEVILHVNY